MRIFSLSLLVISPMVIPAQSWEVTFHQPIPEPVSNNAVCEGFLNDTAYVFSFAGIDTTKIYSGIHNRSYRFNTITDHWIQIPDLPDPIGKIAAAASRIGDTIYIAGGYHVMSNGNEISSSKMHRYRISTNEYISDAMDIPIPIDDQVQCVWRDSLIYIITGWSNNKNIPEVQIYNPSSDTWSMGTPVPDNNIFKAFGASGNIIGDTIYYFGGASQSTNFPAQKILRKGAINPEDPTQISWTFSTPDNIERGYRSACSIFKNQICWIGGSATSYNYDGIAYNGTGGVPPLKRCYWYNASDGSFNADTNNLFPMDLRGIAEISDSVKYLVGGMTEGQRVSNQIYRLRYTNTLTSIKNIDYEELKICIYPNPATDHITLEIPDMADFNIQITDTQGKTFLLKSNLKRINTSAWPRGTYLLLLKQNDQITSTTFILQ